MTAAGFRTRKIKVEQSIGDRLKRARIRRKVSVAEVEEETRIRAKFILALESDSWEQIPSEVYGRGYLEAYAAYLELPVEEMMHQYEQSRSTYWRFDAKDAQLAPVSSLPRRRLIITPKLFIGTGIVAVALIFMGIVLSEVINFTKAPALEIATPAQAKEIGASQLEVYANNFTVAGTTTSGASVTINGQPAAVGADGHFSENVPVQHGNNEIDVVATNLSGKTTSETLSVTVK